MCLTAVFSRFIGGLWKVSLHGRMGETLVKLLLLAGWDVDF